MNWVEINKESPNAFLEWVRLTIGAVAEIRQVNEEQGGATIVAIMEGSRIGTFFRKNEEVAKLPFYFDKYGIGINALNSARGQSIFICGVIHNETDMLVDYFPDRISATAAGAAKAFEIREKQLTQDAKF